MAFSLDDLTKPLTAAEVRESIYTVIGILGVNTTTWKPGAVLRTLIYAASIVIAALSSLIAVVTRGGFLSTSEEEWAELNAKEVYGETRLAETFATGEVTLVNGGGGIYSGAAGDLTVKNEVTGALYRNTGAYSLGSLATETIPISAIEAGSASNAAPGEITLLVTTLLDVTCSNASAVVGQDAETIPNLKSRCLDKLGALSPNGPEDAYSYFAKSATREDGSAIGVTRVRAEPDLLGGIDLYLASASGAVDPADVTIIDELLQQNVVPIPVTLRTHSATEVTVPITYQVWLPQSSALTTTQVEDAIEAELVAFFAAEPIAGRKIGMTTGIWKSAIEDVIGRARDSLGVPMGIFRRTVTLPAGDVALSVSEVAVLGAITATITQVP